ncbi:MAG: long-chain fatty acid--CoA ligase [Candidatus Marinimicrobia bacterium]|nr:long-chain fatty acid--CoA ligase [Candidatus Neomarinimicrobiota bacterium]
MKYSINYLETIPQMFKKAVSENKNQNLFQYKKDGEWIPTTYSEARDKTELIAMALRKLGFQKGDKIALQSENRPEWVMIDFACSHFGFVSVPIYPTLLPKQCEYIINNSESKFIFVSTKEQAEKIIEIKKHVKHIQKMVVLDDVDFHEDWIMTFSDFLNIGQDFLKSVDYTLEDEGEKIQKDDLWTIVYTSGTTGSPKGVMLTHFNIATNAQASQGALHFEHRKRWLSFLPLSHSLERVGSIFCALIGSETFFAEEMTKVPENLKEAKPHYLISVPRLYEKIYAKIIDGVGDASPLKQKIFFWAQDVGSEVSKKHIQKNKKPSGMLGLKYIIAKKLIFSKIHDVFGGEFLFGISGGAPLSKNLGEFFAASGIVLLEGFGLTEATPVTNVVRRDKIKFGTVGPTIPDVEMRIASDGEILFRGPNVMKGYYKNKNTTQKMIDKDNWLYTGDIGIIDSDGFLHITDRKKNLIVTSGGKNIAPTNIENKLLKSKYIDQIVVIGDKRNFISAVIVPPQEVLEKWAKKHEVSYKQYEELLTLPEVFTLLNNEMKRLQHDLARYEQVKKYILISSPFSIDGGELTPSIKIKRRVIMDKYASQIEELYKN